jgi:hypothetical protein
MSERTPYVLEIKAEELEEQIWRMQRQACAYRAEANALRACVVRRFTAPWSDEARAGVC